MKMKKKLLLSGILSLGLCICAMNLTRVILVSISDSPDFTFSLITIALFGGLEVYIGVVVACMPTLGPLIFRQKFTASAIEDKQYASGSNAPLKNSKLSANDTTFYENDFDGLGDNIPLREVTAHGGNDNRSVASSTRPTRDNLGSGGINVKTELQLFSSRLSREGQSV